MTEPKTTPVLCKNCMATLQIDDVLGFPIQHIPEQCFKILRNRAEAAEMQLAQAQDDQQRLRTMTWLERVNSGVL